MQEITFSSEKFPGISLVCPQIPGHPNHTGSHYFAVGVPYLITEETEQAIERQFVAFPLEVKNYISFTVSGSSNSPAPVVMLPQSRDVQRVDDPEHPPIEPQLELADEAAPDIEGELNADDQDLINVEVGKLLNKTIAEAEPQLIKTGGAPELPRKLRVAYLQTVMQHSQVRKGLKEVAEKLLEQI
ncbi:hypothetical protein H6F43_03930 [Leptolyngbya sp. FACHB-36]|uniref:hypothetical protein n=1 Tax=Leptolyngbya sp. FACHB-36 TaxID=2692808 RepID=UPI0016801193|nr:hypothetical protein [Leptolyngbya sp. FACHB-36]MBD2019332.1 hypothetical protein [Leptolyngbya sp. FACHB-36]